MPADIMYVQGHKHKMSLPSKDTEERKSNHLMPNTQMKTDHDDQTSLNSNSSPLKTWKRKVIITNPWPVLHPQYFSPK